MKELIIQIFGIIGKPSALAEMFGDGQSFSLQDLEDKIEGLKKGVAIRVKINSGGGSVLEGFAIYDRLKELETQGHKIITEVLGLCGSMATVIGTAALKENRFMHTNSEYFIHNPFWQPQGGEQLEAADIKQLADSLKENEVRILDHYVAATDSEKAILKKYMNEKKSLTADQAKELGFIGEVIGEDVKEPAGLVRYPILAFVEPKSKVDPDDKDGILATLKSSLKSMEEKLAKMIRMPLKKAGTGFSDWLVTKSEDEAVQTAIIEAVTQEVYDALITGDTDCPTLDQITAIAGATGDDVQTVTDVAAADGCTYDAEAKLVQKLKADNEKLKKELAAAKKEEEPKEVTEMKAELKKMEELIVGLKVDPPKGHDSKVSKKAASVMEQFAENANDKYGN